MPVWLASKSIRIVRLDIPLANFPLLLERHLAADRGHRSRDTRVVEGLCASYVANGFRVAETENFVRRVTRWGNYAGIGGQVVRNNDMAEIADAFQEAHADLRNGRTASAISRIIAIDNLAVSFGSKHLRMIDPYRAVVLDSTISCRLGYPGTVEGYTEFVTDCRSIRSILRSKKIPPAPKRKIWRLSEVEMAIFAHLRQI